MIITFVTPEVDAWYSRCTQAGASVEGPPRLNVHYQIYHFFLRDPDGYRLEVQQFVDPRWPATV